MHVITSPFSFLALPQGNVLLEFELLQKRVATEQHQTSALESSEHVIVVSLRNLIVREIDERQFLKAMLQLETQCLLDLVVVHEQHIQPREVRAALTNAGHAHVLQCAIRQVVVSHVQSFNLEEQWEILVDHHLNIFVLQVVVTEVQLNQRRLELDRE